MPNLTPDDALKVAQTFSSFARIIENFRFDRRADLSDLQQSSLRNAEDNLRSISDNFLNLGVNLVLNDVQGAITGLQNVTDRLNNDLSRLGSINKALQAVNIILQLGTAFATGDPTSIAAALQTAITNL